jgi:hypothetical protein
VQTIGAIVFWFIVLVFFLSMRARMQKQSRIDDAYRWKQKQIHGERKFASRSDLRKAGLL